MNRVLQAQSDILTMTLALRQQLFELITDADLSFTPGGAAPTLGALCVQLGEYEHMYTESFRTLKMDYLYRTPEAAKLATSVEALKAWFATLEADMLATVSAMRDEDMAKIVDRVTFQIPAEFQFYTYRETLLIFYGRASVYLQALNKPLTDQWKQWIIG